MTKNQQGIINVTALSLYSSSLHFSFHNHKKLLVAEKLLLYMSHFWYSSSKINHGLAQFSSAYFNIKNVPSPTWWTHNDSECYKDVILKSFQFYLRCYVLKLVEQFQVLKLVPYNSQGNPVFPISEYCIACSHYCIVVVSCGTDRWQYCCTAMTLKDSQKKQGKMEIRCITLQDHNNVEQIYICEWQRGKNWEILLCLIEQAG